MDAKELTELAMQRSGETSVRTFAKKVGVSHVAVGYWLAGTSVPTFEQAAELAALAGLPIIKTASEVRLHSPAGMKHKSILTRLAATVATLALGVGLALPQHAQADSGGVSGQQTIHYAKSWIARQIQWLAWWLASLLPSRPPSNSDVEA